ncbi:MAG: YqaJ viral recombinase family protein [candidate division WOR-3 bacterium]
MKATEINNLKDDITIGGSIVAAVCGLSKYDTPYAVWQRMTRQVPPKEDNSFMMFGRCFEPAVLAYHCVRSGICADDFRTQQKLRLGAASASIDAVHIGEEKTVIYEIKTTRSEVLQEEWMIQLQWYMGIYKRLFPTEISGKLLILRPFLEVEEIDVEYDNELFCLLNEKAGDFYEKYIIGDDVPAKRYNEYSEEEIDTSQILDLSALTDDVEILLELKEEKKVLESRIERLEEKIKEAMGEKENAVCGPRALTFKMQSRESVDMKRLKAEVGNWAEYVKSTSFRVLRIK